MERTTHFVDRLPPLTSTATNTTTITTTTTTTTTTAAAAAGGVTMTTHILDVKVVAATVLNKLRRHVDTLNVEDRRRVKLN